MGTHFTSVVFTGAGDINHRQHRDFYRSKKAGNKQASSRRYFTGQAFAYFFLLGMAYAAIRRIIFIVYPAILSDGMFNFIVMQTLFYVPFLFSVRWPSFTPI